MNVAAGTVEKRRKIQMVSGIRVMPCFSTSQHITLTEINMAYDKSVVFISQAMNKKTP